MGYNYLPVMRKNLQKDGFMQKRTLVFALVLFALFSVGAIYAQVCVISSVQITGYGSSTVTFTNNSTESQFVRVEVKWDNNNYTREFGRTVPAGKYVGTGRNQTFVPGTLTESIPGIISSIRECF